jgi:tetratricopeptide (TPR) repeat protein
MSARLPMLEQLIARGSADPFVHYARAMELRTLGRSADALSAFDEVCGRFPSYVPSYLMAGQLAIELADYDRARDFLTRGVAAARTAGDDHALSELSAALTTLPAAG